MKIKRKKSQAERRADNKKRFEANAKEAEELLKKVKDYDLGGKPREKVMENIGNISLAGEDLASFPIAGGRPMFHKIFLLKKHIRQLPWIFKAMPMVTDFRVKKLQTMLLLEIAREWTRRNLEAEKAVLEHRRAINPDDTFDSHGFPQFGYKAMLAMATILEADSFYDSRGFDLALSTISVHETCDRNWSRHIARCNKCNKEMIFSSCTEEADGRSWMTFVCPECQTSMSHSKDWYMKEIVHMCALDEYIGHDTYRMQEHHHAEHGGNVKTGEYPKSKKGCEGCEVINNDREEKIKARDILKAKYMKQFHDLFQVTNPFTGQEYAQKPKSKSEELKDKRRRKKREGKK